MENRRYGSGANMSVTSGASKDRKQPPAGGKLPRIRTATRQCVPDVIPCSVNQLLSSIMVNNVFILNGYEVGRVSVVGVVKKIEVTSKFICYKIDDMTSQPIEAIEDVDEKNGEQSLPVVTVGAYVKAFGSLRRSGEINSLKIACIHLLQNMNELTIHILETVNAHMILGKSYPVYSGQSIASEKQPETEGATGGENEASGWESCDKVSKREINSAESSGKQCSHENSSHEKNSRKSSDNERGCKSNSSLESPPEFTHHMEEVLHLIHKCTPSGGQD